MIQIPVSVRVPLLVPPITPPIVTPPVDSGFDLSTIFRLDGDGGQTLASRLHNCADIRDWLGFDPTYTHAMDTIVAAWLTQAMVSGLPAYAPPGKYAMTTGINLSMTSDLEVCLPRSAVLKGTAAIPAPMIQIKDNLGSGHNYGLTWRGGAFDNALGVFVAAAQSNSCLSFTRLRKVLIDGTIFKGALTYGSAQTTTDSGVEGADCIQVTIINCFFDGQGDVCIYLGGNSDPGTADDGGELIIAANHFSNSQQAFALKRQGRGAQFVMNTLYKMYSGVNALEASQLEGGRELLIALNKAKFIESSFATLRASANHRVLENDIEDFGYQADGVTVNAAPRCIRVMGAQQTKIRGNRIALLEWTQGGNGSAGHTAISVEDYSYVNQGATITTTPDRVDYSDNDFQNVRTAVLETSVTAGPTFGSDNTYNNVAQRLTATNAISQFRFFDPGNGGERTIVGAAEAARVSSASIFSQRFRTFLDSVGLTRIAAATASLTLGNIAAGGFAADQTVTLVGAQAGDIVQVVPLSSGGFPVGLELTGFVLAADTVTIRANNANASGSLNMTAAYSYRVVLLRVG